VFKSESATKKAEYARQYYARNRSKILAKAKAKPRTDAVRADDAARQRACYYRHNIEKWREYGRKKRGLPDPTRACPDVCELCGKPPASGRSLDLDHCHVSGEFRGWLCNKCNTGIGALGDNADALRRAVNYLQRFEGGNRV
jgi:Recombination endonuclease VII